MQRMKKSCAWLLAALMLITTVFCAPAISASALNDSGLSTNESYNVAYGCDLSYWNVGAETLNYSLVDFDAMVADGCEFAILRIGYGYSGSYVMDSAFVQFYNSARAAGMQLGVYFYSYATTYAGAVADAEWCMYIMEAYDMYFEYPIYYDVEESSQTSLSSANLTSLCSGWCDTLAAYDYFPGIYGTQGTVTKLSTDFRYTYDTWMAYVAYNASVGQANQFSPYYYNFSDVAAMWQYSWYDYEYDGIYAGMLDVNVVYKDYPAIMEAYGYNNIESDGLNDALNAALAADYTLYTAEQIANIRSIYTEAKALANNSSATAEQKNAKAESLMAALGTVASANESIISVNKSYTATAPNRPDGDAVDWDDDSERLTNGTKGTVYTSTNQYAAWCDGVNVEVTIDLSYNQYSNIYRVYAAGGDWGVEAPDSFTVSYSTDGQEFTEIGTAATRTKIGTYENWTIYCYSFTAPEAVNARYIKVTIDPNGNHTWIDEVEIAYDPNPALYNCIAIDGINGYIMSGITYLYTPSFGTISVNTANHAFTRNIIAKWSDADNAYVVTSNTLGAGVTDTPDVTLASDEIMIAGHDWETGVNDGTEVVGSMLNVRNLAALKVGDLLTLNGIDVGSGNYDVIPYIVPTIVETDTDPDESNDPDESSEPDPGESSEPDPGESSEPDPGESSEPDPVEPECVYGDADGDGTVDAKDYTLVKRHVLGTYEIAEPYRRYCDLDGVEGISASDYTLVKRIVLNTYTHIPV